MRIAAIAKSRGNAAATQRHFADDIVNLASGDTGIKNLTQMQCSASVASGAIDFTIGHAIAFMPCGIANFCCEKDGLTTSFNLERIQDDACLAFLEILKPVTTATTYNGQFTTIRG